MIIEDTRTPEQREEEIAFAQRRYDLAQKMQNKLKSVGLPYHEIRVFGSQIHIACISRETTEKWAHLVSHFAKVKNMVKSVEYNKENKGTCLLPSRYYVWRLWAVIE